MSYFIVSRDRQTVIEFRADHRILGLVAYADLIAGSQVLTLDDFTPDGVFSSGFDECIALNDRIKACFISPAFNHFKG
jgi:hypothetical protein